jgi:hypothetical protein
LLILAVLADMTGESTAQDQRIATLFTEGQAATIFREHLEDILWGSLKVRAIALHLLQKMIANSKSDKLQHVLHDLLAPAAEGVEGSKPRD